MRTERFGQVRDEVELVSDTLAGPLFALFTKGECDYVFADPVIFPTIHDPESFLSWCLSLVEDYRRVVRHGNPASEAEKADQERLLEIAAGMERLSRMAFEIVKQRGVRGTGGTSGSQMLR